MAASFVQEIGHNHASAGNSINIIVPLAGVTAGNTVVVVLGWNSTTNDPTGITDTGGNTYTQDVSKTNTSTSTKKVSVWSAPVTTGMANLAVITASWTSGPSRMSILAFEVSGLPSPVQVDVTANNNSTSASVLDSGTVATTSAAELWVMAALQSIGASTSFTLTPDGSWNSLTTEATASGSSNIGQSVEYQIVSATGTMHPAPTSSITGAYGGCCIAYIAAATGPTNTVAPAVTGNKWVGQTLTSTTGTWTSSGGGLSYAYQWQKDGVNIGGATASTYVIVSGDATHSIRCVVTATDNNGSTTANSNAVVAGQSYTATATLTYELCDFQTVVYTPGGTPVIGLAHRKRGMQRGLRAFYRYSLYPRN